MGRLSSARDGRFASEIGLTLVELLIAMAILGVVLPIGLKMLASVQLSFNTEIDRSVNAAQSGLVMQQIEKEVQSAEAFTICTTATCSSTSTSCTTTSVTPGSLSTCYLLVYTQTNASTRELSSPGPNAPFSCVEWRIAQVASLPPLYAFQSRRWPLDWEGNTSLVKGWRFVSDALPTVSSTFTVPSTTVFGGRLMQVSVSLNNQSADKTAHGSTTSNTTLTRQITGSNVIAAPNPCVPPNGTIPP